MRPDQTRRQDHLSFRGNLAETRYGWLRLTPAYSVHLVHALLDQADPARDRVLDPFCGTGTTALAAAERGLACDTTDINPFLLWLAAAKTRVYTADDLDAFQAGAAAVRQAMTAGGPAPWLPPLHQLEKWWAPDTQHALGRGLAAIQPARSPVADLLKVAFCRVVIDQANVSFGHQSMSFRKRADALTETGEQVAQAWDRAVSTLARAATSPIRCSPRPIACDARALTTALQPATYTRVITSPPYPNRMSYVRELRPYLYWLGYLSDGRAAGELDWLAIGGTWGVATSRVGKWAPEAEIPVPYPGFDEILGHIAARSPLLSRYVHKYFYDMVHHVQGLSAVMAPGGTAHYVVGNSKFYDVLLPVERIFESLFEQAGFVEVEARAIRKRSSKKELFEYVVSARRPAATCAGT